jgi:hypothetical protein
MAMTHAVQSATLADILERVLDKGVVIAGDIKIKLVDIELLTIQIRLLIASVDKAKEMGIDWWEWNPALCSQARSDERLGSDKTLDDLAGRIADLERASARLPPKRRCPARQPATARHVAVPGGDAVASPAERGTS